ncbi:MAG: type II toxin-antitoxin system PemK/MazF family toxin [Gammaproteobacteria bacterium]|nr:type II toxin-antitoxin system PemK/MazF family toxin [Gammaproteobacteria bacterium]
MNYSFGQVVLVGFPFTNLQAAKQRPAVIIHSDTYQSRPDVILMAITSQIREPLATGEALLQDWQIAGLVKPSVLKPLIATLEKDRIVKKLGQLSTADQKQLSDILDSVLGPRR